MAVKKTRKHYEILSLFVGCILIAVIIFVSINYPVAIYENFDFYKVFLALAAGFTGFMIPGTLSIDKGWVKATGAFAAVLLVIFTVHKNEKVFQVRAIVQTSNNKRFSFDDKVIMYLRNEPRDEPVQENNDVLFENIPAPYKDRKVKFGIRFVQNYSLTFPDSLYKLTDEEVIDLMVKPNLTNDIHGTLISGKEPIEGVVVSIDNYSDTTDFKGYYQIILPKEKLKEELTISFYKKGYEFETRPIYLQTLEQMDIEIRKIKND
jgi:hypothetical protein